jgi:serine protease inhibitor
MDYIIKEDRRMKKLGDFEKRADESLDNLKISQESKLGIINSVKNVKKTNLKRFGILGITAIAAVLVIILFLTGRFSKDGTLKVHADDIMKGITPQKVERVELNAQFVQSTADFSIDLFKNSYTKGKNSLVSPTSVYLALGMTANGADGNTLKEFETLLGKRGINVKELNSYYNSLTNKQTSVQIGKVNIANSIWYRSGDGLNIERDFLQTNADYYNAAAYKADFNSKRTVQDINNWVKANTGKQIDKVIDTIDGNAVMYLINTIYFDQQWEKPYKIEDVREGKFDLANETKKSVDFMYSDENGYLKDDNAQGFIKPYKSGKYSFVALLPNEGVSIDSYVSSLTGEGFLNLLKNKTEEKVSTALPKFKSEYQAHLVDSLKHMGLKECFDVEKANFTKMISSTAENLYVSDILHKTFITVDTEGTKAAAATKVEMTLGFAPEAKRLILNRPFLYAIVDNDTELPLFIGTMMEPGM